MYSNEYIEHWSAVFVVARLLEQGIPLQEFLEDPWGSLKAMELPSAPHCLAGGYQPLLPRQAQVAQDLWQRWELETDGAEPATPQLNKRLALTEEEDREP